MDENQKNELENEIAESILRIIGKHITTGIRNDGYGKFLDCSINFKFLHKKREPQGLSFFLLFFLLLSKELIDV